MTPHAITQTSDGRYRCIRCNQSFDTDTDESECPSTPRKRLIFSQAISQQSMNRLRDLVDQVNHGYVPHDVAYTNGTDLLRAAGYGTDEEGR